MNREIFSFFMLFAEPILLPLAGGWYIASLIDKKNREKKQKIAWSLLIFTIVQAIAVVVITMAMSGR